MDPSVSFTYEVAFATETKFGKRSAILILAVMRQNDIFRPFFKVIKRVVNAVCNMLRMCEC